MINRSIVPLTLAVLAAGARAALAQSAFPAPLPDRMPADGSPPKAIFGAPPPFSSAGYASSLPPPCMRGFVPLRDDAEMKARLIREAAARHAPPAEACKLIRDYSQAEVKVIRYVETSTTSCGVAADLAERLKADHNRTDILQARICAIAEQTKTQPTVGPSLNEVIGFSQPPGQPRGPVGDFLLIR